MPGEPAGVPPVKAEPKTQLGEFFRAHRTEVLAGAGILVAGYAYYRSKHPSSAAASNAAAATSPTGATGAIDPNTGVPYSTELADAEAQGIATSAPATVGGGGTTGYGDGGGTGYSGGGGYGADIYSELQSIQTTLANQGTLTQVPNAAPGPISNLIPSATDGLISPSISPTPSGVPTVRPALAAAAATTAKNLAADKAAAAKNPSAKNVAAVKALTARLKKET